MGRGENISPLEESLDIQALLCSRDKRLNVSTWSYKDAWVVFV